MNNDGGSIKISHDPQPGESASAEAPTFSTPAPTQTAPEPTVEAPNTATTTPPTQPNIANVEPVDIFATEAEKAAEANQQSGAPNSHISNSPFNSRSRFRPTNTQANPQMPQFFNDAIVANTPIAPAKKSHKGIIIGAIVAIIAIGAMVAVLLMSSSNNNIIANIAGSYITDSDDQKINVSSKNLFYKYANEALYGIDSEEVIKKEQGAYAYSSKIYASEEFDQNYAKNLLEKYNTFYDKLRADNKDIEETQLFNVTQNHKNLLTFISLNPSNENLEIEHILQVYAKNGRSSAVAESNKVLEPFNNGDDSYATDFYEMKKELFENVIEYSDKLSEAGCLKNKSINSTCVGKTPVANSQGKDLAEIITSADNRIYDTVSSTYRQIGQDCWEITNIIEGKQ